MPDPIENLRGALHRFTATVTNLHWYGEEEELATLDMGPRWRSEEWDAISEAAAGSMRADDAETTLADAIDEVREAARPSADDSGQILAKSVEERRAAIDRARALVDEAVANRPTTVERRLASERVADARSRGRFAEHDDYSNEASLVVAVAAFELLLGELVRAFLLRYPDSLKGSDRKFSALEILESIENAQDLRELLIDQAVDAVIGRSPDKVRAWFEDQRVLDLKLERNCVSGWESVREIFERRHTIVHSGSEVTARYAACVENSSPIGSSLRITGMYMEHAFEELLAFGVSIAVEVWARLYPDSSLAALVCASGLIRPLQSWGDRSRDPWPVLRVVVEAMERVAAQATGPDAEGFTVVANLTKLWWSWNDRFQNEGVQPVETIRNWSAGPSVAEQFAIAALASDTDEARALLPDARDSPAFALLALLPRDVRDQIRESAGELEAG